MGSWAFRFSWNWSEIQFLNKEKDQVVMMMKMYECCKTSKTSVGNENVVSRLARRKVIDARSGATMLNTVEIRELFLLCKWSSPISICRHHLARCLSTLLSWNWFETFLKMVHICRAFSSASAPKVAYSDTLKSYLEPFWKHRHLSCLQRCVS